MKQVDLAQKNGWALLCRVSGTVLVLCASGCAYRRCRGAAICQLSTSHLYFFGKFDLLHVDPSGS